jgi:hypothetical protein
MSKYVIIGIVAAVLLTICVISYFLYTRYKKSNNKCSDNSCNTNQNKTCTDDLCTRPEPEKVEPVENTTLVNENDEELEESE